MDIFFFNMQFWVAAQTLNNICQKIELQKKKNVLNSLLYILPVIARNEMMGIYNSCIKYIQFSFASQVYCEYMEY